MRIVALLISAFWRWIDAASASAHALREKFRTRRLIRLVENDDGTFTAHSATESGTTLNRLHMRKPWARRRSASEACTPQSLAGVFTSDLTPSMPAYSTTTFRGCRLEVVLRPQRFLVRSLELPRQAIDFLEGIVRAQIDRLTPWSASEAAFGWTKPVVSDDRIKLSIVAINRGMTAPFVRSLSDLGAVGVAVATLVPGAGPEPVTLITQQAQRVVGTDRLRRILAAVILASAVAALASFSLGGMALDSLDADLQDLSRKIAGRRAAMHLSDGSPGGAAQRAIVQRKQATPSSVLVLEALSKVLPDHTYVSELHIEGDRLQIVGVTRDAPSLIELIEQSGQFTRATFFAPTTQTPGDPGERFHIEARIKTEFAEGS